MHEHLTDDNFLIYCAKRYDNPQAITTDEFLNDLDRIKYIKKLITRYTENDDLKDRLILNHIMTIYNCFGLATTKILFLKLQPQFHVVKPFLILLGILPARLFNVGEHQVVETDAIPMDSQVIEALRKLTDETRR